MTGVAQSAFGFLLSVGLLVLFHELGHYLVARWCGVKVLRFSVGFGRVLASRRHGPDQTEWVISAIPLGGYVKMLDEREGEVAPEEAPRAFNRQHLGKRFAIVLAGPVANLGLAVLLYTVIFANGVEGLRPVLEAPPAGSIAQRSDLQRGDEIHRVAGSRVQTWQDLRWRVLQASGSESLVLGLDRGGSTLDRQLDLRSLKREDWEADFLGALGLHSFRPRLDAVIGELLEGKPAARAGMRPGDRVLAINGDALPDWEAVARYINARPDAELVFQVERAGVAREIVVRSESLTQGERRVGRVGISPRVDPATVAHLRVTAQYSTAESFAQAVAKTWDLSIFTLKMLKRIVFGEASLKNISGPLTMADFAGQSVAAGWIVFVGYLALISVSLGVLNLLPIPLLDGGHLMYYTAELVTGRPVSDRVADIGQRIGIAMLLLLMSLALYNDFNHLLSKF
ncbi:MAG: RIP metalloprotease RseP [Betaproteobacteria bacterium]|nr:RIP metalloprotease RseP [Betaproteobacteria bacterium]